MLKIYSAKAALIDKTDGLSISFDDWRFNLRQSNTEPLVRLNVETKGSSIIALTDKVNEIAELLGRDKSLKITIIKSYV